jgi:hypothetical protein
VFSELASFSRVIWVAMVFTCLENAAVLHFIYYRVRDCLGTAGVVRSWDSPAVSSCPLFSMDFVVISLSMICSDFKMHCTLWDSVVSLCLFLFIGVNL